MAWLGTPVLVCDLQLALPGLREDTLGGLPGGVGRVVSGDIQREAVGQDTEEASRSSSRPSASPLASQGGSRAGLVGRGPPCPRQSRIPG